ncbi:MAG: 2-phosphosulfolactate phosphatase, partial [Perlabentimonas sp.]
AISAASQGKTVVIGSFINISSVADWIVNQSSGDLLILCAGWKGKYCIEDPLFAGALAQKLMATDKFVTDCDSTQTSIQLWDMAKTNIMGYLENVAQRHRLKKLGLDDVLEYCFTPDSSNQVPVLVDGKLVVSS